MEFVQKYDNPSPETNANFVSKIFFCWMLPFLRQGYKKGVELRDIYNPTEKNLSEYLGDILERNWKLEIKNASKGKKPPSLLRVIIKTFGFSYMKLGVLVLFTQVGIRCSLPYLLGQYIKYFQNNDTNVETGWILGASISVLYIVCTIVFSHFCVRCQIVGIRVKVACCSLVYRKILKLSLTTLDQVASGQIVNLLSNDMQRFDAAALNLHFIYVVFIQVIVMMCVMYTMIGISGFPGLGFIVLEGVVIHGYLSKIQGKLRSRVSVLTGRRLALMNDIVSGIQVIKMYAWEKPFEAVVSVARKAELKDITKSCYIKALTVAMVVFSERFCLFLTILIHVLMGHKLTGDVVFSTCLMLNIVQASLCYYLPQAFQSRAEIMVSIAKLQEFLLLDEKTEGAVTSAATISKDTGSIRLMDVRAGWVPNSLTLTDVSLNIKQGTLCCVLGKVGAGKTSFLQLLLKELPASNGKVDITGKVSYASQEPWLFVASVRNNILFGQKYLHNKYQDVVNVCALNKDFKQFPHRDQTIVGERGVSLSGGQRARVNLARAVYLDADIYLLDDPLSAVDAHVSKHLFEECITKYLQKKTRVLVTHQVQFLKEADLIVVLEEGKISKVIKNDEVLESSLDQFTEVLPDQEENVEDNRAKSKLLKRTLSAISHVSSINGYEEEMEENEEVLSKDVSFSTYWGYYRSGTGICFLMWAIGLFLVAQVVIHLADVWTMCWTNEEERELRSRTPNSTSYEIYLLPGTNMSANSTNVMDMVNISTTYYDTTDKSENSTTYFYLCVYSILIFLCIVLSIARPLVLCKVFINASKALHSKMLSSIIQAPMRFFETNPSGRIMNRFSKDLGSLDEVVPSAMLWSIQSALVLIGLAIVICAIFPWVLVPLAVAIVLTYYILIVAFPILLKIVKLEANNRSPIFSHISTTVNGLPTIRSAEAEAMAKKYFESLQDVRTGTEYMVVVHGKTFGFYLECLWNVFLAVVTLKFIAFREENIYGGQIGLIVNETAIITGLLQYGLIQMSTLISNMVSVERIRQYTNIEKEDAEELANRDKLMKRWPHSGKIVFTNVCLTYVPGDPPVLHNLNFNIRAGEKIGVVGRTGAGKSSLISCLFRLAPLDGTVAIDDIDTAIIDLKHLRSNISIIPQEPVLFSESLRYNLDPLGKASDETLWKVLENVKLKDAVDSLDQAVANGGSNFSVGQRQLICLARAILNNNKVLVMDEATANVDQNTDALIQMSIRENFRFCTVLTIAHRLNTIMDSDRVLVMNLGRVMEFAHPHELLQKTNGHFSDMVRETGPAIEEVLRKIAKDDYDKKFFEST